MLSQNPYKQQGLGFRVIPDTSALKVRVRNYQTLFSRAELKTAEKPSHFSRPLCGFRVWELDRGLVAQLLSK